MKVEAPERIWIESEGECPYFYHEDELPDVAPPITEYARANVLHHIATLHAEIESLRVELETERMRLAACGVVALANTPDSAKQAREMLHKYLSASCGDVARMVDENIKLRARIDEMEKQEPVAWLHETRRDSDVVTDSVRNRWGTAPVVGAMAAYSIPLYLAPGAKGE